MPANTLKMMTLYELKAALMANNVMHVSHINHNACYVPTNIQIS